ncbi:MAG: hypothetical protein WAN36_13595, partial [Calditrichia bacterium]
MKKMVPPVLSSFLFFIPNLMFAQERVVMPISGESGPPVEIVIFVIIMTSLIILTAIISFIYLQRKLLAACNDLKYLEEYLKLPFGVPVGTIRSVITLIVVAVGLLMFSLKIFYGNPVNIPETLTNIIMAVIAFYFGTRSGARQDLKLTEEESPPQQGSEPDAAEEKSKAQGLIGKARQVIDTVDVVKDLLPENERKKMDDILETAKEQLGEAEKAEKKGNYSAAKTAANLIHNMVSKQDYVKDLIQNSVGTIGTIIGANPATAVVGSILRIGSTLGGNYYEKWRKRILDQPIEVADVNPNILDADTAQAVFI